VAVRQLLLRLARWLLPVARFEVGIREGGAHLASPFVDRGLVLCVDAGKGRPGVGGMSPAQTVVPLQHAGAGDVARVPRVALRRQGWVLERRDGDGGRRGRLLLWA